MIIVVDGISLTKPISGVGRVTFELCKRFSKSKDIDRLVIACPNRMDDEFAQLRNFAMYAHCNALFWYIYGLNSILSKVQPNLFFSPSHRLPLRKNQCVPTVVLVHDLIWKKCPSSMSLKSRCIERILFPHSVVNANHLVTVSKSTARDLIQYYPNVGDKITTIYPASTFEQKRKRSSGNYILFVGTFEPRKNILLLLRAYSEFVKLTGSKLQLYCVGHVGWGNLRLGREIRKRNLENLVKVVIGPTSDELADIYQNCLFLVLPSKYEGFGLTVVEAMSFQKPSIVSNKSSLPEVIGSAGLVVDVLDSTSLANAMRQMVEDKRLYAKLSHHASQRTNLFCWNMACSSYIEIFKSVAFSEA